MSTLTPIDWTEVLAHLEGLATAEVTREAIRDLSPLPSQEAAQSSFQKIEETEKLIAEGRRPSMESLDLFSTWYERLKKQAVLKPLELKDVRHFCLDVVELNDCINQIPSEYLSELQIQLTDAKGPLSSIDLIMTASGDIRSDASEDLYSLFREKQEQERQLQTTMDKMVKTGGHMDKVLRDRYVTSRGGRLVVPVRTGMQKDLKGIVHDQSASHKTVFVEPQEIVTINSQIERLEAAIEEEIQRLLAELSRFLYTLVDEFESSRTVLMELDLRLAQAQLSQQLQCHPCEFKDGKLSLRNVRHPMLVLQGDNIVPNDVELDNEKRILLLSGPNAGGKTVLLKAVGLAVQMARCGLPICADKTSKIPFFEHVVVAVGDDQSVIRNLSTFAAHLSTLTEASRFKGGHILLLIDEICSSTDPEEGAALARSFIETFEANGVFGIITSHLGPLKENWPKTSAVINGRLEYDEKEGHPTYRLFLGMPGKSLALRTARTIGVPEAILSRALELLTPETRERQERLDELENMQAEVSALKEELRQEEKAARDKKETYQKLVEQFKRDHKVWLEKATKKAQDQIDRVIEEAREKSKQLKELHSLKGELPQIIKTPQEKPAITTSGAFENAFPPGSLVYIPSLQQEGLVQSTPDNKGRVTILSQSMRLQLPWSDLTFPKRAVNPAAKPKTNGGNHKPSFVGGGGERTIDLRGQRVEEALKELESQFDVAIRNGEDRVKIIHGHGTEALKKALRTYISRSQYVRKWKSGDHSSGGDGVTWVELID